MTQHEKEKVQGLIADAHGQKGRRRLSGTANLIISTALAVIFFIIVPVPTASHVVLGWDVFCLSLLALIWWSMLKIPSKAIRREAQHQDSSRIYIFVVSLMAALVSLFSVVQMILSAQGGELYQALNLFSGIGCMILSWMLVHTIFAVRYAPLILKQAGHKNEK